MSQYKMNDTLLDEMKDLLSKEELNKLIDEITTVIKRYIPDHIDIEHIPGPIDGIDYQAFHECDECTTRVSNGSLAWAMQAMINGEKVRHYDWASEEFIFAKFGKNLDGSRCFYGIYEQDGDNFDFDYDSLGLDGYELYEGPEKETFDIDTAIKYLKSGLKVRRCTWLKNEYIFIRDLKIGVVHDRIGRYYDFSLNNMNANEWELYSEK